jgi:hypothetical protein
LDVAFSIYCLILLSGVVEEDKRLWAEEYAEIIGTGRTRRELGRGGPT